MMGSLTLLIRYANKTIKVYLLFYYLLNETMMFSAFVFFQFFEMPRHEAIKALEIYRRAGQQVVISLS